MLKNIQKHGNSSAVILTQDMINHLGVSDVVDISFEAGRLVLTKPAADAVAPPRALRKKQSFREAADASMTQYHDALAALAK